MSYTPKDVIVYLTDFPWKFLVKKHNGVVTQLAVPNYSKATNYRNVIEPGHTVSIAVGNFTERFVFVPPTHMPVNLDLSVTGHGGDGFLLFDDIVADAVGISTPPRNEFFTRNKLFFGTDEVTGAASPYFCWEDEFRGLGDVDPDNELDD